MSKPDNESQGKTTQVPGLFPEVPPRKLLPRPLQLTPSQHSDLREAAARIVESEKLDAHPWEAANAGKYPEPPTEEELEEAYTWLMDATERFLCDGVGQETATSIMGFCRWISVDDLLLKWGYIKRR